MSQINCTVCGIQIGYAVAQPCDFCKQPKPEIGMGVTFGCWTDRMVGTIIAISKSGKQITVQTDTVTRVDNNGMSEVQDYTYSPDPNGGILTFKITSRKGKKSWRSGNYKASIGVRRYYHDFSF